MAFIFYVTQIQIEFGAIRLLTRNARASASPGPLIVTDPGVKAAGLLQKALDALPGVPVAVYDQTPSPIPTRPRCVPPWRSTRPASATA